MAIMRLHQITAKLDRVFASTAQINDEEVKSHLSRYLCVLTSGYIEESLKIIIRDYISSKSHPNIINYVSSKIKNTTSLNFNNICVFLNNFNDDWKAQFEDQISDEEKDSINSIVANRHLIAHGHDVGVSYVGIANWYNNTKSVVSKIHSIVNS